MGRLSHADLRGLFRTLDPRTGQMMLGRGDAEFLGRVIEELERLGKWQAAAPLLTTDAPEGRGLVLGGGLPTATLAGDSPGNTGFYARLQGSAGTGTSPYGFDEYVWDEGSNDFVVLSGGRSSSTGAIEATGKPNLGSQIVYLYPLDDSNWYFQWIRAASCAPCSLPWGTNLHATLVNKDAYCNPTTLFNETLTYVPGGINFSGCGGGTGLIVSMGLPNTPGYWDTGAFAIAPFTCSNQPGVTFSFARLLFYCGAQSNYFSLNPLTSNTLRFWLLTATSAAAANGWPSNCLGISPGPDEGPTNFCLTPNSGMFIGSSGLSFSTFSLQPGWTCSPLFLQTAWASGVNGSSSPPTCPTLLTVSA